MVKVHDHTRRVVPRLRKFRVPDIPAFHKVSADEPLGYILSKREIEPMCKMRTQMVPIDRALGDDDFVFLSVGRPPSFFGGDWSTCFMFDAEELVREGATVRTGDILYTNEADNLEHRLFDADNEHVDSISTNNLERLIRINGDVRNAWQALVAKRDRITHKGDEAIRLLRRRNPLTAVEGFELEILVPKRLSISKALLIGSKSRVEQKLADEQRRARDSNG